MKFDNFEKNGEYVPATAEKKMCIRDRKSTGSPVLAMSDIKYYQYDKETYSNILEGGFAFVTIKIPANTLDPSKQYVICLLYTSRVLSTTRLRW